MRFFSKNNEISHGIPYKISRFAQIIQSALNVSENCRVSEFVPEAYVKIDRKHRECDGLE